MPFTSSQMFQINPKKSFHIIICKQFIGILYVIKNIFSSFTPLFKNDATSNMTSINKKHHNALIAVMTLIPLKDYHNRLSLSRNFI